MQILQAARRGKSAEARKGPPLTDHDIYLFREGTHGRLYDAMGCHLAADGARFRVWAPNAARVSVIGDFNRWDVGVNALQRSEEHTSELQSRLHIVCRLLLEKKTNNLLYNLT